MAVPSYSERLKARKARMFGGRGIFSKKPKTDWTIDRGKGKKRMETVVRTREGALSGGRALGTKPIVLAAATGVKPEKPVVPTARPKVTKVSPPQPPPKPSVPEGVIGSARLPTSAGATTPGVPGRRIVGAALGVGAVGLAALGVRRLGRAPTTPPERVRRPKAGYNPALGGRGKSAAAPAVKTAARPAPRAPAAPKSKAAAKPPTAPPARTPVERAGERRVGGKIGIEAFTNIMAERRTVARRAADEAAVKEIKEFQARRGKGGVERVETPVRGDPKSTAGKLLTEAKQLGIETPKTLSIPALEDLERTVERRKAGDVGTKAFTKYHPERRKAAPQPEAPKERSPEAKARRAARKAPAPEVVHKPAREAARAKAPRTVNVTLKPPLEPTAYRALVGAAERAGTSPEEMRAALTKDFGKDMLRQVAREAGVSPQEVLRAQPRTPTAAVAETPTTTYRAPRTVTQKQALSTGAAQPAVGMSPQRLARQLQIEQHIKTQGVTVRETVGDKLFDVKYGPGGKAAGKVISRVEVMPEIEVSTPPKAGVKPNINEELEALRKKHAELSKEATPEARAAAKKAGQEAVARVRSPRRTGTGRRATGVGLAAGAFIVGRAAEAQAAGADPRGIARAAGEETARLALYTGALTAAARAPGLWGAAGRVLGRVAFPAVGIYYGGKYLRHALPETLKQGQKAYEAYQHQKRTEKHTADKYGSIARATRTRKARQKK